MLACDLYGSISCIKAKLNLDKITRADINQELIAAKIPWLVKKYKNYRNSICALEAIAENESVEWEECADVPESDDGVGRASGNGDGVKLETLD